MWADARLFAFALACGGVAAGATSVCAQTPATAQPLPQVDPWGMGALGAADALPPDIWAGADATALRPLFQALKPEALSPAGRRALSRLLLSSTRPPANGDSLTHARLELIERLGAADFAADIRRSFPSADWSKNADLRFAEVELATVRAQSACRRVGERPADDIDWMPVRALCLALAGDFDTAALAGEQVVATNDARDPWLLAAIETMRGPTRTPPEGRYGNSYEVAVSVAARLSAPRGAMNNLPSDIALSIVRHPSATPDQKRAALGPALAGRRLSPDDVITVLGPSGTKAPATTPGARKPSLQPASALLETAVVASMANDLPPAEKATAFQKALTGAEAATDFHLAALALSPSLRGLPRAPETQSAAEVFARAALAVGDVASAREWRDLLSMAPAESADPWSLARIDFMLSLARAPDIDGGAALAQMTAALAPPSADKSAKVDPALQRKAELRRIEAARALFLHAGLGRPLPPQARDILGAQKAVGRGVSDAGLLRAQAALDAGARGEAALAVIALLTPDIPAQSFAGLADALAVFRAAGLESDAEALALESVQVHKAF